MSSDHPVALPDGPPVHLLYPAAICLLLLLSAVALTMGSDVLGVVGVVTLAVLSLAYGAIRRPEELF